MKLLLPHLAKGFSDHRRAIFGFGPHKDEDTGKLLKVHEYAKSVESMQKLKQVQDHNLNEERSVGSLNYELGITEKANIESASKKMIISKSLEFLTNTDIKEIYKYRKPGDEIKELKTEYNRKKYSSIRTNPIWIKKRQD